MTTLIPVLLAGGEGKRLGPVGTHKLPKQFHHFGHSASLLQQAARRAMAMAPADCVVTIVSEHHAKRAQEQLAEVDASLTRHLIAEPMPRNTATAATLAAQYAVGRWKDPVLAILPTDHHIENVEAFCQQFEGAVAMARKGKIVLFGVTPDSPSSHYGYVLHAGDNAAVTAFHEKPPTTTAQTLIATGRAFWNSGMFVMQAHTCLEEMRLHAPSIFLGGRDAALAMSSAPENWQITEARFYESLPCLPIDKAVMEKSERLVVLPLASDWADLGSPEEAERVVIKIKNQPHPS